MPSRAPFAILSTLALALAEGSARAELLLSAQAGKVQGTLSRGADEAVEGLSTSTQIAWQFKHGNAHAFFYDVALEHDAGAESHVGVLASVGLGGSVSRPNDTLRKGSKLTALLQVPVTSTYVVLAESTGTINGSTYKHSSLATMSGILGVHAQGGYEFLVAGRGGNKGENIYAGLHLGYMYQQLDRQTTKIRTNNSAIAPPSPGTETVDYSLSLLSLSFSFAYDF